MIVNVEVASSAGVPDLLKSHFVTAAVEVAVDIDDSINRKFLALMIGLWV